MKSKTTIDILIAGDLNIDYLGNIASLPGPDEEVEMLGLEACLGGSGANAAVVAHRLGMNIAFYSAVGCDSAGNTAVQMLEASGVPSTFIKRVPQQQSGLVFGVISENGLRQLYSFRGANLSLYASDIPDEALAHSRRLHLNGPEFNLAADLLQRSRKIGIPNSLDPGAILLSQHLDEMDELLANTDILLVNDDEFIRLSQGEDTQQRARNILSRGVKWVVVKCGADGATVFRSDDQPVHGRAFSIRAIDTTGAGDAFNAAFITGLLNDLPLNELLTLANAIGAMASLAMGATSGIPEDSATIQEFISQTPRVADRPIK